MATIKGQNLRIFINDTCVAASRSCTLHTAASVQDVTTKDSGDWAENEVTELSWDASVEGLIVDGVLEQGNLSYSSFPVFVPDSGSFTRVEGFPTSLAPNVTIIVTGQVPQNYTLFKRIGIDTVQLARAENTLSFQYNTSGNEASIFGLMLVVDEIETPIIPEAGSYVINDNRTSALSLMDAIQTKSLVGAKLSVTTGALNSQEQTHLYSGNAYINDFSIQATNRQASTFSCQLTGKGELEEDE